MPKPRSERSPGTGPWKTGERGATLAELGIALGLAAAVLAGALTLAGSIRTGIEPVAVGKRVGPWVDALGRSVAHWYRERYCHAGVVADYPIAVSQADAEAACAAEASACVAAFVPPRLARLQPGRAAEDGVFTWRVASPPASSGALPPPRVQIGWQPPSHLRRDAELLARELGTFCDDDGDAATVEACDGTPAAERLVWDRPLEAHSATRDVRFRRLEEWLARNAVDCDFDDDGALDPFCDGPVADGRIDAGHVVDVDGDGCDDARPPAVGSRCDDVLRRRGLLDRNADGRLDLDANGDLAVDQVDFHAFGC